MPVALNNQLFPVGYSPWYVYRADLVASPTAFDKYDILVPTAGKYDRAADDADLSAGYVIALEKYKSGKDSIQVAAPGSLIPSVAGGAVQPNGLVKVDVNTSATIGMRLVAATAADLAAGKVVGRMRNHKSNHINLKAAAANDIIHVLTGAI